jgi:hypothetical protein
MMKQHSRHPVPYVNIASFASAQDKLIILATEIARPRKINGNFRHECMSERQPCTVVCVVVPVFDHPHPPELRRSLILVTN